MNTQIENAAFQYRWSLEEIRTTFFKCTRWQVEDTMDPITCPYHYFCDSIYPGDYPPAIDILLLLFTMATYFPTLMFMLLELYKGRRWSNPLGRIGKFLLPSGPLFLPICLLAFAKGHRISTIIPLSSIGPAILQLIQISCLAFDNEADEDIKYAFFKVSTISGILHASLYLDSIILPYYTGYDALVSSSLSGWCVSCVCRKEALVVGGSLVKYRGWSRTTFCVVGTLCLRIVRRMSTENNGKGTLIKSLTGMECLCWISICTDCAYLIRNLPSERSLWCSAAFAGVLVLICLHVLGVARTRLRIACTRLKSMDQKRSGKVSHIPFSLPIF